MYCSDILDCFMMILLDVNPGVSHCMRICIHSSCLIPNPWGKAISPISPIVHEYLRKRVRDDIKSLGKISILNQFKIEGGRGSEPSGQFKIECHKWISDGEIRV